MDRAKLKDIQDRLAQLRSQRTQARQLHDAYKSQLVENPPEDPTKLSSDERFQRANAAMRDIIDLETKIEAVEHEQALAIGMVSAGDLVHRDSLLGNTEALANLERLGHSKSQFGSTEFMTVLDEEQHLASFTNPRGMMAAAPDVDTTTGSRTAFYGIVPMVRQPVDLLDLIPVASMGSGTLDLAVESSPTDYAVEVVEGSAKAGATQTLTDVTVRARTIANFEKMKRQQLADVAGLQGFVENALIGGVRRRLQSQILNGDGSGETLTGIVNTAGIGAPASAVGDNTADTALNLINAVRVANGDPSAIVLNPADWMKIRKLKASTAGDRMEGALTVTANRSIDGVPVVLSNVVSAGYGLCGDFSQACTVFVREAVNVRFSDSDQNDFILNKVTSLAEGRYGFIVWRPTLVAYKALN